MREVWLRPNRRSYCRHGAAGIGGRGWTGDGARGRSRLGPRNRTCGSGPGRLLIGLLAWQSWQARLGYEPGFLLVYLRLGRPIRVPVEFVECCFMGSGPLKLTDAGQSNLKTANLVLHLADRAPEWANVPVKPALGKWADGYITIHGAWCEPLSFDLLQRINTRLHEIQHSAPTSGRPEPLLTRTIET